MHSGGTTATSNINDGHDWLATGTTGDWRNTDDVLRPVIQTTHEDGTSTSTVGNPLALALSGEDDCTLTREFTRQHGLDRTSSSWVDTAVKRGLVVRHTNKATRQAMKHGE